MKKLLTTIIVFLMLGTCYSADYITPIFYQLGADDSLIGHFMVGKTGSDLFEDGLNWEWWQSGLVVAAFAYGKEALDESQHAGSFNWKDAEWTIYGWLFKRFLTFKWEF